MNKILKLASTILILATGLGVAIKVNYANNHLNDPKTVTFYP